MKRLLSVVLLSVAALSQAQASVVLFYLKMGEVYLATDAEPGKGGCSVPQLPAGLMLVSLGVGPAFDAALDTDQLLASLDLPTGSPEKASLAFGDAAAKLLEPLWKSRRAVVLTALERSGFAGARPALQQFCFVGLQGGQHLEISCGAVVPGEADGELTVEMQPSRTVSGDRGEELLAFGLTEGLPSPQAIAGQIGKQGPAKALKRLVAAQGRAHGGETAAPVTVLHYTSYGEFQWESGAKCAADKAFGSLRKTGPEREALASAAGR